MLPQSEHKLRLGQQGEAFAWQYLAERGYQQKALRWRCGRLGELDIVCESPCGQWIVGVEVKTRRPSGVASGWESALSPSKQRRLAQCIEAYHQTLPLQEQQRLSPRLDWMVVALPASGLPRVHHVPNLELPQ